MFPLPLSLPCGMISQKAIQECAPWHTEPGRFVSRMTARFRSQPHVTGLWQVEKELAGLPKQSAPRGGSSGILSPRQSAADQPWTSRLADVSLPTLQAVPDKFVSSPIPAVSSGANVVAADTTAKPPPRMADTILQACDFPCQA